MGRAHQRGDRLGAALIAARLDRDLCHLTFLQERRWPPYPKWLGTALVGTELGRHIGLNDPCNTGVSGRSNQA